MRRSKMYESEYYLANESLVRLGWPIGLELGFLFAAHQHLPGRLPSEANERVLKLGWTFDQPQDVLTNERVVSLGWAIDQSEDSLANEKVQNVWIRILFSKWESSKTRMTYWPWTWFLVCSPSAPARQAAVWGQWEGLETRMRSWLESSKTRMTYWPIRGHFSLWEGLENRMTYQPNQRMF